MPTDAAADSSASAETKASKLRLQVFLAHCGAASRREGEKLITAGRVSVNGIIVSELGTKVEKGDVVMLDGRELFIEKKLHYLALNKPPFYLCSSSDDKNRPLAFDLLPKTIKERLYSVGRLDYRSSGLIIFTNDGDFAAKLSHPSSEIEKEYLVSVSNAVPQALLDGFSEGITIENVRYQCKKIEVMDKHRHGCLLKIILNEGKNREIRNVFSFFHLHLSELKRVRIGPVCLGELPPGKTRPLTSAERLSLP